jgi:hypothetical protein
VRKGYERVIRPRFADAKFFFDEDLQAGPGVDECEGLKTVTYQAKLGTVADKVARVAALAEAIARKSASTRRRRAAPRNWPRTDLQSRMVNEFPELQGIAGPLLRTRRRRSRGGGGRTIALAIDEAYQPRFAGDDIALSPLGKVLAIAERGIWIRWPAWFRRGPEADEPATRIRSRCGANKRWGWRATVIEAELGPTTRLCGAIAWRCSSACRIVSCRWPTSRSCRPDEPGDARSDRGSALARRAATP